MAKSKFAQLHSGLLARKGEASPAATHPLAEVSFTDRAPAYHDILQRHEKSDGYSLKGAVENESKRPNVYLPPSVRAAASRLQQNGGTSTVTPVKEAPTPVPTPPAQPTKNRVESEMQKMGMVCSSDCEENDKPDIQKSAADRRRGSSRHYKVAVQINAKQRQLIRTVAAVTNSSQQSIMRSALNDYLKKLQPREMKECRCFKKRLEQM